MAKATRKPEEIVEIQNQEIPSELPVLGCEQFVLFPFMIAPLLIRDARTIRLIDDVVSQSRLIGLFAPRTARPNEDNGRQPEEPEAEGATIFDKIQDVGCVAMILRMLKIPDGTLRVLIHGVRRVRLVKPLGVEPYPRAVVEPIEEIIVLDDEMEALKKTARTMLRELVEISDSLNDDLIVAANNTDEPGRLADLIASSLSLPLAEQQTILGLADVKQRLLRVQQVMNRELELARIGSRIQTEVKSSLESKQRDFFLREQLKAIRRELGEDTEGGDDLEELRTQIEKARMPGDAERVSLKELYRLSAMSPASPEYTVSRTYLDWLVALPWNKRTRDNMDLKKAQQILDRDHYDLEKIKERILEYLAVIKLRRAIRGPILCLVGPPGVGKTSLGRSVAESMGRRFVRISLGGVRDEAEIRGHRRTYIGSMPGRIIKSLKEAGSRNPLFMLDEIDKLGSDFRGDPASALLEVLDPQQNANFVDHYLDLPFDLSEVMFITTANTLDTIPSALLDRMEVVRLAGYTLREKLMISQQYLIPRALENTGLKPKQVRWQEAAVEKLIEDYTREAGLRNLEREITAVCRKIARRQAEGEIKRTHTVTVTPEMVRESLGPERFDHDVLGDRTDTPGVAVGLAWTPTGGDILFIEATATPSTGSGPGRLLLTGQLGDVMKESAHAARTYLHAFARQLGLSESAFARRDLHIHVPAGAIPKDGPSAGIALLTALASLLTNRPIRPCLAMTGEITLKGNVLPVGGIKEKVLAAHRSGVETLILPARNAKDLDDVPEEVREALTIHFVEKADEVLRIALPSAKSTRKKAAGGRKTAAGTATRKRPATADAPARETTEPRRRRNEPPAVRLKRRQEGK